MEIVICNFMVHNGGTKTGLYEGGTLYEGDALYEEGTGRSALKGYTEGCMKWMQEGGSQILVSLLGLFSFLD